MDPLTCLIAYDEDDLLDEFGRRRPNRTPKSLGAYGPFIREAWLSSMERECTVKISDPALRGAVRPRAQCTAAPAERFERARGQARAQDLRYGPE